MRNFISLLTARWALLRFVCVGLDSALEKIPACLGHLSVADRILEFNKQIVDATHHLVAAYKPNLAFYLDAGIDGLIALRKTIEYIKETHPDIAIILDAKWGDIDATNDRYVGAISKLFADADAVTIHPILGQKKGMQQFLANGNRGAIILCRTSNEGGAEFQDLPVLLSQAVFNALVGDDSRLREVATQQWEPAEFRGETCIVAPFYQHLAVRVARFWNTNGNCALVTGATYPDELALVRALVPDIPLLIPGVGKQQGDLEKTVRAARKNFVVNNSTGITFASNGPDFAEAAGRETEKLDSEITRILKGTVTT